MNNDNRRHSIAAEAFLIKDETEKAEAEARNGLLQFDVACRAILDGIE